ncbi:RsiV family protein [Massilia sp. CFBP9012]|uniref:RsiV family protein n=1 Tax=Massilia sp. CFBP9012 TaxID=3096531 RepID=UPI002A6B0031|nr:RsiV family protein [Massilia sp. CFBP9012]MDY0976782.1 RsiV family protein [Massilia sp. CFBP9012]
MRAAACLVPTLLTLAGPATAQEHGDLLQAPERIEWEVGGLYEGRFPDGRPFQVALAYPAPGSLPGDAAKIMDNAYWFPRDYTGKARSLEMLEAPAGVTHLAPLLDSGAQAPERFSIALDAGRHAGKGSWTQEEPAKTLPFSLKRIVAYRAVAVTRPSPQAQAEGSDQPFVFSAVFPVFGDKVLDAWVRDMAGRCDADTECTNKVLVRWHSKGQLSLDASAWTFGFGAAHGNYGSSMRHYALGGGKAVHTRFTGFVDAGTACREKVSAALVARLAAQGLSWAEQGALDVFKEPKFIPLPSGIEFHWDPYEVGSFAQGIPSVFLTRAELEGCVRNLPHGG